MCRRLQVAQFRERTGDLVSKMMPMVSFIRTQQSCDSVESILDDHEKG